MVRDVFLFLILGTVGFARQSLQRYRGVHYRQLNQIVKLYARSICGSARITRSGGPDGNPKERSVGCRWARALGF